MRLGRSRVHNQSLPELRWGGWGVEWLTVVGVVGDVRVSSLEKEAAPASYIPIFRFLARVATRSSSRELWAIPPRLLGQFEIESGPLTKSCRFMTSAR